MRNGSDTHRNFELEEFIFDDTIKEEVTSLVSTYRSNFQPNTNKNIFVRDMALMMQGVPLFEELKYFYNNDVCISCATCISVMKGKRYNLRTHAYYFENAVHRIEEAWEYTHILLNQVLGLELVIGMDIWDTNIQYRSGTWIFQKSDNGYVPIFTPYKGKQLEDAVEIAKKDNILLIASANKKKSIFHKMVKRKFAVNDRIAKIQELFFSEEACELHRIRNEFVHRRPLGAKYSVAPCIWGPGQAVSIDPQGWFVFLGKETLIEKNIAIIRTVLQEIQDIIYNHDLPNTKENENKEYFCVSGQCSHCNEGILLPEEMYDFFKERNLKIPCPCCGKNGVSIKECMQVDDRFYFENLQQYNEAIAKAEGSIFEEEDLD